MSFNNAISIRVYSELVFSEYCDRKGFDIEGLDRDTVRNLAYRFVKGEQITQEIINEEANNTD